MQEPIQGPERGASEDTTAAQGSGTGSHRDIESRRILARVREGLLGEPAESVEMGRYLVLDKVGSGGLGVVYAAFDPELDRKIAVKLLKHEREPGTDGAQLTSRVLREAQAMARLSHPNVVDVYDVGTFEDRVFIAMEFVDGPSLKDWLEQEHHPRPEVLRVLIAAGRGLNAAHEAGLVHRDFKPDNVMIGSDGRVRVLDFGLARPVEGYDPSTEQSARSASHSDSALGTPLTATGTVMGTPAYMAPEQHLGEAADARGDQFAFCVTLFEALYGRRPFAGADLDTLALRKRNRELVEVAKHRRAPRALHRAIVRGLSPRADDRWPSMQALLLELERAAAGSTARWLGLAAAGGGLLALAFAAGDDVRTCDHGQAALATVWGGERSNAVEAAFAATGAPHASDSWTRVERHLVEYGQAWLEAHHRACEADQGRAQTIDLRMICLDERLRELDAVVGVLLTADAEIVTHAVKTVSGLAPLARCADDDYLSSRVKPPDDPAEAREVQALRAKLSGALALKRVGKFQRGISQADEVVAAAERLDYRPLVVEAQVVIGELHDFIGDYPTSRASYETAYYGAVALGHDEQAFAAANGLLFVVGYRLADAEAGMMWGRHAESALSRAPANPEHEAKLLNGLASTLQTQGRIADGLEQAKRALAVQESVDGGDPMTLAAGINNVGVAHAVLGHSDEALRYFRRGLWIRERVLGPHHPDVANSLNNISLILSRGGAPGEAAALLERALVVIEESLGPDHEATADLLGGLGHLRLEAGRLEEAMALYERSLTVFSRTFGSHHPQVVGPLTHLGSAVLRSDQRADATRYQLRATRIAERALPPDHPLVATAHANLGSTLVEQGQPEAGLPHVERALELMLRTLDPGHPHLMDTLTSMGGAYVAVGRDRDARPYLERSLALRQVHGSRPRELAMTQFNLARALWSTHDHRRRALALARSAHEGLSAVSDPRSQHVKVWLTDHAS